LPQEAELTLICYTLGYTGRKLDEIVRALDERDAILFDIRYSPRSRNPVYNRAYLESALRDRYSWVKDLGNVNYALLSPIKIANYPAGKARITVTAKPVALMCVCENAATCHRTVIADLLLADGFQVEEIQWGSPHAVQGSLFEE
jgi:uncharacterized protein (DUF488 family)